MRGKASLPRRAIGLVVAMTLVAGFVPVGQGFAAGAQATSGGALRYAEAAKQNAKGVAGPLESATPKRVLVKWTPGVQDSQIKAAGDLLGFKVVRTSAKVGWTLVEPTRKGLAPADLATSLRKTRLAARAEVEKVYSVASTGPNDPRYPEQWSLNNTGQTGGTPARTSVHPRHGPHTVPAPRTSSSPWSTRVPTSTTRTSRIRSGSIPTRFPATAGMTTRTAISTTSTATTSTTVTARCTTPWTATVTARTSPA